MDWKLRVCDKDSIPLRLFFELGILYSKYTFFKDSKSIEL